MNILPTIKNAYLFIQDDKIVDYGKMEDSIDLKAAKTIDASGQLVLPAWCDSHTHIVYAGNRDQEFVDRINGLSYEDIAERGGGILNSSEKLQNTSEEELFEQSAIRIKNVMAEGTGAIEIKSGYGLSLEAELKMLRVIKRIEQKFQIKTRSTFLGAHAFPKKFQNNKTGYIDLIVNDMLPKIAEE
ncbi:MAG: imidazolonepropionase, partial [Melioribacteraceae bacterium]|nr:imidazolonepropionase [Melioribacteraceae bacterium]